MKMRRIAKLFFVFLPLAALIFAGIGWAVLELWNWLMPSIFTVHAITYWQALGLMALSWILFRGFRGPRFYGGSWRHGMRERWEKMTPAEREVFAKAFRSRWGGTTPPEPEAKA
jgi:hypothetical protein